MNRSGTFGQRLGVALGAMVVLILASDLLAAWGLRQVVEGKDAVITGTGKRLILARQLEAELERRITYVRGYLLTQDRGYRASIAASGNAVDAALRSLKETELSSAGVAQLDRLVAVEQRHRTSIEEELSVVDRGAELAEVLEFFEREVKPVREELAAEVSRLVTYLEQRRDAESAAASAVAERALWSLIAVGVLALLLGGVLATLLTRALSRQIGSTVTHVRSSSAELQTAANQQAAGAKEQSSAMGEITTTISELLATAKQISQSAVRVSAIASDTADGAREGDRLVEDTSQAVAEIRRQVDLIVEHMLELGRKSQQAGGILDIINELAEQTNILAINATIEAAAAGESGRRFAAVGTEIRKLADRVASSTKDIRALIEEIRGAVNTTVMATETGSKAVDAGAERFVEVRAAFERIASLVATTTDAAREIELSTKQQTSAMEQVTAAVRDVAQTARQSETSTEQTLATAAQLTELSQELARLVRPGEAA